MFFVTVAHSSLTIPDFLRSRVNPAAKLEEIAEPGIDAMFRFPDAPQIACSVHQCFPNLNRARDGVNPRSGASYGRMTALFPAQDFHGTPIFLEGAQLSPAERARLLNEIYDPFYASIEKHIASGDYDFFLDVHAMNAHSTSYQLSRRFELDTRPDICLGNNGDAEGKPIDDMTPLTFPTAALQALCAGLTAKGYVCTMNVPFRGGNLIQTFGPRFPCIQIEINKRIYMTADDGEVIDEKVTQLNRDFGEVLKQLHL